jgi:hypothetical protein
MQPPADDEIIELTSKETIAEVNTGPPGSYFLPKSKTILIYKSPLSGGLKFVRLRTADVQDDLPQLMDSNRLTINKAVEQTDRAKVLIFEGRAIVRSITNVIALLVLLDAIRPFIV